MNDGARGLSAARLGGERDAGHEHERQRGEQDASSGKAHVDLLSVDCAHRIRTQGTLRPFARLSARFRFSAV
jgi:hypothetical protein